MEQSNLFEYLHESFKFKKSIRLIELFAGYGSQAMAMKKLQDENLLKFEHHKIVEFDKYAIKSYNAIHGTHFETSDICDIHSTDLEITETDKYDYVLTYSFPCQDLSKAGKGKGMTKGSETRSGLLWEVERILGECYRDKCLPKILLMENVPDVIGSKNYPDFMKWYASLEACGYQSYYSVLNAKNYGIPQNRDRCFMISILGDYNYTFPKPFELKLRLKDVLEDEVNEKYYISDSKIKYMKETSFVSSSYKQVVHNEDDISRTLCARDYKDPKCVEVFDYRYDERVMDRVEKGICPTLTCKTGTGGISGQTMIKEPTIVKELVIGSTQKNAYIGSTDETSPSLTSSMGTGGAHIPMIVGWGVAIPEATKKGYALAGDGVYINRPHQKRGVVQKGTIQTLKTSGNDVGVVVKGYSEKSLEKIANNITDTNESSKTITANPQRATIDSATLIKTNNLRIRKLTPRECGRLMGVRDNDIAKMLAVNSNSQCYKQFGNSIVVDVLYYIFKQMC